MSLFRQTLPLALRSSICRVRSHTLLSYDRLARILVVEGRRRVLEWREYQLLNENGDIPGLRGVKEDTTHIEYRFDRIPGPGRPLELTRLTG